MNQNDAPTDVKSAAFGPDSAFVLLQRSVPVEPLMQDVEQVILDDTSFNAFAEQNADTDRIGIHSGTIARVTEKIEEVEDFLSSFRGRSSLKEELWWDELDETEVRSRLIRLCVDFIVFH